MKTSNFSEIEAEFIERAHDAVWCSVATLDTQNRLRSRVLHPIWEGQTGWVATGRKSLKSKHLQHNPHITLAYIKDPLNPVYVDCRTAWVDDNAEKKRIWELFLKTPPPLGYDPTPFFGSMENPAYGLLKLTPWRIELAALGKESKIWKAK